jgi:hypothetical protein
MRPLAAAAAATTALLILAAAIEADRGTLDTALILGALALATAAVFAITHKEDGR